MERILLKYTFHTVTSRVKLHVPPESSTWEEAPTSAKARVCFGEVKVNLVLGVGAVAPRVQQAGLERLRPAKGRMTEPAFFYQACRGRAPKLRRLYRSFGTCVQPRQAGDSDVTGAELSQTPSRGFRAVRLIFPPPPPRRPAEPPPPPAGDGAPF